MLGADPGVVGDGQIGRQSPQMASADLGNSLTEREAVGGGLCESEHDTALQCPAER